MDLYVFLRGRGRKENYRSKIVVDRRFLRFSKEGNSPRGVIMDRGGRVIKISKKRIIIIIIAFEDGRSKKSDEDQNYLGSRNCER